MKVVEIVKAHFVREEFDGLIQTENGQDMAKQGPTGIVWTNETWNPVTGCTKVSQGCKH